MKSPVAFVALLAAVRSALAAGDSPIGKVVQLLSDLQAKVVKEGEESHKIYASYAEWCEDRARDLSHEIKTGQAESESLKAAIAEEEATTQSLGAKIDELAAELAKDEADLKAATEIRELEHKDFLASEAELVEMTDMLGRAVGILEREMAKGGASMVQLKNAASITQALGAMVDAALMSSADVSKLTAFLQSSQGASEDESEPGAPAASVYEGHSGDIIDTLNGLKDKADEQLDETRKTETTNLHNFQRMKQSLEDEIKFGKQDLAKAKKGLAESAEAKSKADGDLQVTSKDLAEDISAKGDLHQACMMKAEDYEAEQKSRDEELKAIAEAKKVLEETTGGAADISYGLNQVSFVQTAASKLATAADLANFEAVRLVRNLAQRQNSAALAQLAQRMGAAMRSGAADPFSKVKSLIADMIDRLESEAEQDASHKTYCDKELAESEEKEADKEAEIKKQTTRIDKMSSRSAMLKEEVAQLQADLAALAKAQAEMDKIRAAENAAYQSNKADMEKGLAGVKMALKVLNEYYAKTDTAHTAASGAGANIIGLLEVVESDFSKNLAEIESAEETAAADYDRETKENAVEKTTKDKDVEHKVAESVYLDKESAELSSDRATVQAELDAVNEYLAKLHKECDEVAETYAERKARYEAEIAGLKEALTVLENETALLQRHARRHRGALRGGKLILGAQ